MSFIVHNMRNIMPIEELLELIEVTKNEILDIHQREGQLQVILIDLYEELALKIQQQTKEKKYEYSKFNKRKH